MYKIVLFALLACLFYSCSTDSGAETKTVADSGAETPVPSGSADISIELKNMSAGPAYLIGTFSGKNFKADSTTVNDKGQLNFKNQQSYKPGLYFVMLPNNEMMQLLLGENQNIKIVADASDIINTAEVSGSIDTRLLLDNYKYEANLKAEVQTIRQKLAATAEGTVAFAALRQEQEALNNRRKADLQKVFDQYPNTLFTAYKRAGQNPEIVDVRRPDGSVDNQRQLYLYRTAFWDNVDFNDSRLLYTPVVYNKLEVYMNKLTTQQSDSIVSAAAFLVDKSLGYPEYYKLFANYIAVKYQPGESTLMDAEKVQVFMIQNYFTKERAFWSDSMEIYAMQQRAAEMKGSLRGLKGPDVTSLGPDNQQHSIYGLSADYIVVYLYTPTCEHCMEQTPKLVELYNQTNRKDLDVFAIALDTNDAEWKDYIKKNNMNWTNVYDPSNRSIYGKYYVDNTPEVYVLNPDRMIIGKNLKVEQIREVMRLDKN